MTARPNILVLQSDQHSAHIMSCAGHPVVRTPNLDRLAAEGVRFSNVYCPAPLCQPSRAASLTGRHGRNTGVTTNKGYLRDDEPTFAQALQEAGYHTAFIGKTHLGQSTRAGDSACDEWLHCKGFTDAIPQFGKVGAALWGTDDCYQRHLSKKGMRDRFREDYRERRGSSTVVARPSVLPEEDFHDNFISDLTCEWIAEYSGEQPFFCWCNWGGPHAPFDAPGRYAEMYAAEDVDLPVSDPMERTPGPWRARSAKTLAGMSEPSIRECRAHYYGLVNVIDDGVGRVLQTLERRGLLDNTVVVYTSDHGEMLFEHGLMAKSTMYEEAVKVPLLVRWPERFRGGRDCHQLVSLLDLTATCIDLAAAETLPVSHGKSLIPLLEGRDVEHRRAVFSELGPQVEGPMKMVREGRYKFIYHPGWEIPQLFDLEADPRELTNLAGLADYAEVETRLRERLLNWCFETDVLPNTLWQAPKRGSS